ncbi:hypothetical protein LAZ67_5000505 [Cordylochernes scorpioides]|uniref:Uncharacterized protein n=1 Tax=Cordylochernes scorpioides TaxID=51811 RepID=A0ABY6KF08_9ARAC|nr:hypothetical protein LAZ67_5000505 [Cordylochernes scorpioides]
MYAIKLDKKEIKKSKGTKKSVVDKTIKFEDYYNCLFNKEKQYRVNNLIRSNKHEIATIGINKIALSPYDDKRYILDDGINTRAYGFEDSQPRMIWNINQWNEFYRIVEDINNEMHDRFTSQYPKIDETEYCIEDNFKIIARNVQDETRLFFEDKMIWNFDQRIEFYKNLETISKFIS